MTGLQISLFVLVISVSIAAFFILTSIYGGATRERRAVEQRIVKINVNPKEIGKQIKDKRDERRRRIETKARSGQSLRRKKLMDTVFNELVLAGIMMGPEEFTIMWICLTFGPSGISALLGANPIASITMAVLGCVVPLLFINFKKGKRRKAFEAQLSDALMVICNCLRSGLSFQQAIETIAKDMPAPIGVEFSRVCSEIQYGETLETALNNMANRIKSSDLLIAVSAVSIQRQTGGNLSKILDTISVTIKDRLKIKSEISALTAQGRTSGMIIGALPIVVAGMLMIIASDYMSMFFTTKVGRIMLVVAAVMEVLGFFAIRKVVSIEY